MYVKRFMRLLQEQDIVVEVLEHLYLRPLLEAKFFLKVRMKIDEKNIVQKSGATIMAEMDLYGLHEYEFNTRKVVNVDLQEFSR